jgi:4-hydroxy-2-oxoheptanedioate aldolase
VSSNPLRYPCASGKKRDWLERGPFLVGTFCQSADPMVVEIMGRAGFDFIVLDGEHGPVSSETMKHAAVASTAGGIVLVVRVKHNDGPTIMAPLDMGALGVQVPHVATPEAARKAMSAAKYHPTGERGLNPFVRAAGYSSEDFGDYMEWANENTLVVLQVEGVEGVSNIDGILEVPGVDVIFLGPYDLSQSLGVPGQVHHPSVIEKMQTVISKANRMGMMVGTFADTVSGAREWIELGLRFIALSYDTKMLFDRAAEVVRSMKSEADPANIKD